MVTCLSSRPALVGQSSQYITNFPAILKSLDKSRIIYNNNNNNFKIDLNLYEY